MSSNTLKQAAESARAKASNMTKQGSETAAAVKTDFLHTPFMRAALPFINGGVSGMIATTCIQPIDMVKVRLQLAGEGISTGPKPSALAIGRDIIAKGKILDLYTGLSAGLLRQGVYTTARLGLFDTFMGALTKRTKEKGTSVGFAERALSGLSAGGLAAFIGKQCLSPWIRSTGSEKTKYSF